MSNNIIVNLKDVNKFFLEENKKIQILENLDLQIFEGEKIAIVGPSGSGKSTILSLLAGLDVANHGEVIVNNKDLSKMKDDNLSKYRNTEIGIIFQSFELILPFSVYENVIAPQEIKGKKNKEKALELIDLVNLKSKLNSGVSNLSGGEKQRVAIARALSNNPNIILADEPTGSLDRITGKAVLKALLDLVNKENKTLILITHDEEVANQMDKIYLLKDKKLILQ